MVEPKIANDFYYCNEMYQTQDYREKKADLQWTNPLQNCSNPPLVGHLRWKLGRHKNMGY